MESSNQLSFRLQLPVVVLLCVLVLAHGVSQFHPPFYGLIGQEESNYIERPHNHYPVLNVTSERDYLYFVSRFNFDDAPNRQFFIGAEDRLLQMNMADLTVNRELMWAPNSTDPAIRAENTTCKGLANSGIACANHIRIYTKISYRPELMLVCGSHFTFPKCSTVQISDTDGMDPSTMSEPTNINNNDAVVSIHPLFPNFGEFINMNSSDHRYFTIAYFSLGGDELVFGYLNSSIDEQNRITFTRLLKQSSEEFWLAVPNIFINYHSFNYDNGDYNVYYVFFREKRIANPSLGYTRVVQICKSDRGTDMQISGSRIFSSFAKANIICKRSSPNDPAALGALNIEYDVMRSNVLTTGKSRYQGNQPWNRLMYAIFTGSLYSFNGTAVCVYEADETYSDNELLGAFRDKTQGKILRDEGMTNNRRVVPCSDVRTDSTDLAMAIQSSSVVQQGFTRTIPLLEIEDTLAVQLAVDQTSVVERENLNYTVQQDVVFLGTEDGRILKMVQGTRIVNNLADSFPIISETIKLADNHVVRQMQIKEIDGAKFLYVSTFTRLYKIALHQCSKHTSCRDCIAARDPYCFWNTNTSTCVHYSVNVSNVGNPSGQHLLPSGLYQDVHSGESSQCAVHPSCSNIQAHVSFPSNDIRVTGCEQCSYTTLVNVTVKRTTCEDTNVMTSVNCTNELTISDPGLRGFQSYNVEVEASNGTDTATYIRTVTTNPSAPLPISGSDFSVIDPRPVNSSHIQIRITLDGCQLTDDPSNYSFTIDYNNNNGVSGSMTVDYLDSNSVIVGGFRPCDTVQFNVTVINSRGSTSALFTTTLAQDVPAVPVSPSASATSPRTIMMSYSPPSMADNVCSITGYSVYIGNEKQVGCAEVSGTSYTIDGLSPFTSYDLSVSACTAAGEGPRSPAVSETTLCEDPFPVENLGVASTTSSSIQFQWVQPQFINGTLESFNVERSCYNYTSLDLDISSFNITTATINFTGVSPLTQCCIKVSPIALCMSATYRGDSVTECGETNDVAPEFVQDLDVDPASPTSLLVTWDPPANYRRPGLSYTVSYGGNSVQTGENYYLIPDLVQNTLYTVRVLAENSFGVSALRQVSETTLPDVPRAPTNIALSATTTKITVAWVDTNASAYAVNLYTVRLACNNHTFVSHVTAMTAMIDIGVVGSNLIWCSAQVQGHNSIGPGQLSMVGVIALPLVVPSAPRCFLTHDITNSVIFSFTITDAVSLTDLQVKYSVTNARTGVTVIPETVNIGDSLLNIIDLSVNRFSRATMYEFQLRLCNDNGCSSPCSVDFDIDNVLPQPPTNIACSSITSESVLVTFESTESSANYDVQLGGANRGVGTYRTTSQRYNATNLFPGRNYFVSVRTIDTSADLTGQYSVPIDCRTSAGTPSPAINISATLNGTSLYIVWIPSSTVNGLIDGWHAAAGNAITNDGRSASCDDLYTGGDVQNRKIGIIDNDMTFLFVADLPELFDYNERDIPVLYCVRSFNTEGQSSSWLFAIKSVAVLERGALSPFNGNLNNQGPSTTVVVLAVVAVLAIVAAVVIAIILALAIYFHNKKLTPSENYGDSTENQNTSGTSSKSNISTRIMKRIRTPQRLASTASQRPMVVDSNSSDLNTIKGTESDNSSTEERSTEH